jgi:hypothetical protein
VSEQPFYFVSDFEQPFYFVFDSVYRGTSAPAAAKWWQLLNWTVSVMMLAVTAPMSFGLELRVSTNWSA